MTQEDISKYLVLRIWRIQLISATESPKFGELVYSLTGFWLPQLKGTLMREYRQLSEEDRIEIYAMKQAGKEQNMMATESGVHPNTISRELSRNTGLYGYRPNQAQQKALLRRLTARKAVKMMPETVDCIERKLAKDYSPDYLKPILSYQIFEFCQENSPYGAPT
jgi:transposase-like protein